MRRRALSAGRVVWRTINEFLRDGCPQMAAAISFYTLLSLPPLLVVVILFVGPFISAETVVAVIEQEAQELIGTAGAEQIGVLLENAARPGQGGPLAATFGAIAFVFGATAAFSQLQGALNAAWQVGPDPERGDVINFLIKRLFSFLMILGIGILIAASLILSALVTAFGAALETVIPAAPSAAILRLVEVGVSFTVLACVFTVTRADALTWVGRALALLAIWFGSMAVREMHSSGVTRESNFVWLAANACAGAGLLLVGMTTAAVSCLLIAMLTLYAYSAKVVDNPASEE